MPKKLRDKKFKKKLTTKAWIALPLTLVAGATAFVGVKHYQMYIQNDTHVEAETTPPEVEVPGEENPPVETPEDEVDTTIGLFNFDTNEHTPWTTLIEDGVLSVDDSGVLTTSESAKDVLVGKLVLSNDVTSIADNAFIDCTSLQQIDTANVTTIGEYAFKNCTALTTFDLNDCVTGLGNGVFQNCTNLTTLNISANSALTTIGSIAFNNSAITSLYVPKNVTTIFGAFAGMYKLTEVEFAEGVNVDFENLMGSAGSVALEMITATGTTASRLLNQMGVFLNCSALETVNIPDSVVHFAVNAFYNCTSLKSLVLPNNLIKIYQYAFANCNSLETIVFPEQVAEVGTNSFRGCTSLKTIYIPSNITKIGATCFSGCTDLVIYCQEDIWSASEPTWCAYNADGDLLEVKTGYTYEQYYQEVYYGE